MQLTRSEAEVANDIVTKPEKWYVVTRNSGYGWKCFREFIRLTNHCWGAFIGGWTWCCHRIRRFTLTSPRRKSTTTSTHCGTISNVTQLWWRSKLLTSSRTWYILLWSGTSTSSATTNVCWIDYWLQTIIRILYWKRNRWTERGLLRYSSWFTWTCLSSYGVCAFKKKTGDTAKALVVIVWLEDIRQLFWSESELSKSWTALYQSRDRCGQATTRSTCQQVALIWFRVGEFGCCT